MKKLACIVALSGAFVSLNAAAWGNDGHRAVGAIADQLIKGSNAQQHVDALLLPGESLESIASWADCVKGNYCGPQTQEMKDYVAANPKHSEYHYTDVPYQDAHYRDGEVGTATDDIVQTLKQAIAVLEDKGDDVSNPHHFTKRQALLLVVHLTGDIHQPLHVGAAYIGKDGGFVLPDRQGQIDSVGMFDTRGGNDLLLDDAKLNAAAAPLIPPPLPVPADESKPAATYVPAKSASKPFHSYWDTTVVDYAFRRTGVGTPQQFAQAVIATKPEVAMNTGDPRSASKPFHSYWDTTVVDYAFRRTGVGTPQQFAQAVIATKPEVAMNTGDPIGWPYQWADDALVVSKLAFAGVTPGQIAKQTGRNGESYNVWALAIPDNYPVPSSATAKTQLIKGGYHLAELLQAIWK